MGLKHVKLSQMYNVLLLSSKELVDILNGHDKSIKNKYILIPNNKLKNIWTIKTFKEFIFQDILYYNDGEIYVSIPVVLKYKNLPVCTMYVYEKDLICIGFQKNIVNNIFADSKNVYNKFSELKLHKVTDNILKHIQNLHFGKCNIIYAQSKRNDMKFVLKSIKNYKIILS